MHVYLQRATLYAKNKCDFAQKYGACVWFESISQIYHGSDNGVVFWK